MLYRSVADLELEVSHYLLEPLKLATGAGWTRHTTVVHLCGKSAEGLGEDVTYETPNQIDFQDRGPYLPLEGRHTLESFSHRLDELDLFPDDPISQDSRLLRRWAFESAALDLALRQAGTTLAEALDREPQPASYVVSLGLDGDDLAPIERVLEIYPGARFKVDLGEAWSEPFIVGLGNTDAIDTVDLKGHYRGAFKGPTPDPDRYRWIAEHIPDAWLEDPALEGDLDAVLRPFRARITWDAVLHSVADLDRLPFRPKCVNMKPSRFGFVSELLRAYDYCASQGIAMYGGGQFELGPGRGQVQYLASLFHPDAPNDVAPSAFNDQDLRAGLPASPLAPAPAETGFGWRQD